MPTKNKIKTAIVIGSGFGGLASAIRLQSLGFKVIVCEKRDMAGGRAYVYKQDGFTFDAGPTVITAPTCLEEVFETAGKDIADYCKLMPVHPFYQLCWEDGVRFNYGSSLKETTDQIQAISGSEDVAGYKKFLAFTEEVFREGYEKLSAVAFLDWWSMVKVAPQLIKLKAYQSVYQTVGQFIKNEKIRQAFSFHTLLVGGNPFETPSIYTLIHFLEKKWGVFFPEGGTGALVQAFVRLFKENGGELLLNCELDQIVVKDQQVTGVRTRAGEFIAADLVVSNADVMHTYKHLLSKSARGPAAAKDLAQKRYSMSLFLIYFGAKKKFDNIAHHMVLFGPRYKELLQDIFKKGELADDFSLYLHAPTVTDPSLAPEGCEGFYVLSPVPHLGLSDIDWNVEGPKYADRILTYLDKHYLHGLKENLVTQKIFTPLEFEKELNAHNGSAFSLEPILTQSAYFRVHNRDKDIAGLYFVGAGTHPGAGLPGVVQSAKATCALISEDYGMKAQVPSAGSAKQAADKKTFERGTQPSETSKTASKTDSKKLELN
jgi:phytoene desaturase